MSDPNQPGSPGPKGDSPTAMFKLKLDNWMEELFKADPEPAAATPPTDPAAAPSEETPPEQARKLAPPGLADAPGFATQPVQPPKR